MGESLRETAGSSACLWRCNECHFGIGDRRKAILRAQHAMIGENGDLGQDADAEAGRDSGLNGEKVGGSVGDMPGANYRLERIYRPVSVKASLLEYGERQRIAAEVDRVTTAGDPAQALRPGSNATGLFHIAFQQREVEIAAFERAAQLRALSATHVESQAPMRACKGGSHHGQALGSEI